LRIIIQTIDCCSGSQTFLVMYPLDNLLSIKYSLTVIMSKMIRNVPIVIAHLR